MNDADARRMRQMVIGLIRMVDDEEMRLAFVRRLKTATRHAMRVWVRDHSGFPPELKNQILSTLQKAEGGT